ncbi:MAG: LPS export ABC transporter periplasmic protein LptC [Rhodocyclaceae bacterium]|nr:LPS export ABC transporter periplasmic protein LptC [Rhodocyclaceae bacterium]
MTTRGNPASTLFPLLLVGLLAGMSYWLELASRPQATGADGKSRHDPDYIVEKFEVRRFDPEGALQHTLVADLMRHYPDDDSTVILAPRITYHRTPPTFVSAREARLDSKGKHVELIDDVRVARTGAAGKPDTVLTTTKLDAWPDDEIAKTSVPVTITQGQTNVTGSGLNVDNKTSIYVLEGPVRGVFFRNGSSPAEVQPVAVPITKPKATPKPKAKSKSKPKSPR